MRVTAIVCGFAVLLVAASGKVLKEGHEEAQAVDPLPIPGQHASTDLFAGGQAKAIANSVLKNAMEGDAAMAATMVDGFSRSHQLGYETSHLGGLLIEESIRNAASMAGLVKSLAQMMEAPGEDKEKQAPRGLRVLVLGGGMLGGGLKALHPVLSLPAHQGPPHELVAVESDPEFLNEGRGVVAHALGRAGAARIRFTGILRKEGQAVHEVLQLHNEGLHFKPFDLVLIPGKDKLLAGHEREQHLEQLKALLAAELLHPGSIVHAEGPAHHTPETEKYLRAVSEINGKNKFSSEVHDIGEKKSAVVSTYSRHDEL